MVFHVSHPLIIIGPNTECPVLVSHFYSHRKAKMFLDEIVSRGRGTPPSFHESSSSSNGGQGGSMQEMIIPAGKAGLIIGKGGETIKQLQVGGSQCLS